MRVCVRVKVGKCHDLATRRWATAGTLIRGGRGNWRIIGEEVANGRMDLGQLFAGAACEAFRATGTHLDSC